MEDYGGSSKRSGQIPVFGDWECADELPITQYFENARQAGLRNRYTCSSSSSSEEECCGGGSSEDRNVRTLARKTRPTDHQKNRPSHSDLPPKKKPPVRRSTTVTPHLNRYYTNDNDAVSTYPRPSLRVVPAAKGTSKPVDEDLYKIPPELLHTTKRKKMLGFFSRCLVPGCAA